jgi:hypothetical protein
MNMIGKQAAIGLRIAGILIASATQALAFLPEWEEEIVKSVACEYKLSSDEVQLLRAIRRVENGRSGLQFGVGSDFKKHPAKRSTSKALSFRIQCQWAAGTIKKRFNGSIYEFAKIWCPYNAEKWAFMVQYWRSR